MPFRRILPGVAILLIGQAILDAAPAIIAEREGGMGLGSALIGAFVSQVAGVVLGAVVAGHLVDRRSAGTAMLGGAYLFYVGLLATGMAPMGSLATVVAGMGVAGIGFGGMLTSAFANAATIDSPRTRVAAVALLLSAPIGARAAVGTAFAAGPPALLVGAITVVGLALVAVRLSPSRRRDGASSEGGAPMARNVGPAVMSGVALAIGATLAIAGADPSRLSASLIAGTVGMGGFDTIDAARAVMFVFGVAGLLIGAAVLLARTGRRMRVAVPGLLLVGLAGTGVTAALTRALTAGRLPDAGGALIGVAAALGGLLGLALGVTLLARGRDRRLPAIIGSGILAVVCVLGWLALSGQRPEPGDVTPIALVGIAGVGLGLAATALRLVLTDVELHHRGIAAGAGVAAAVIGSALGGLLGAGEGMSNLGGASRGVPIGLIAFAAAATASVALAATLSRGGPPDSSRPSGGDRLSRAPS